ncbi:hypothetical protein [Hyalangium gracile]|uniref:hypothetical protein n=1 Tax=Hyalangium gracile TaxID=394092 RepID=UPI001CC9BA1C|nr:hypothetical protein [Hyalangium gracile]
MNQRLLFVLVVGLACSPPRPVDPDIWRPLPGEASGDAIPGPLKNFGPFDSFADALKAACPLILSKPNATVVHLVEQDRQLASRVSTEYCAWLYLTPEDKYELSMLTDMPAAGSTLRGETSCALPVNVNDPRYPPESIKYIFCVHNHPFSGELSEKDIFFAAAMANAHELVVTTKEKKVPLAVIAFFSNSRDPENPTCDGFYQYIPATRELLRWTHSQGLWEGKRYGTVHWRGPARFIIQRE